MSPSSLMWCVGMTSTRLDGSCESMLSHVTRSSGVSVCMQYCSSRRCMHVLNACFPWCSVIYRILGSTLLDMSLGTSHAPSEFRQNSGGQGPAQEIEPGPLPPPGDLPVPPPSAAPDRQPGPAARVLRPPRERRPGSDSFSDDSLEPRGGRRGRQRDRLYRHPRDSEDYEPQENRLRPRFESPERRHRSRNHKPGVTPGRSSAEHGDDQRHAQEVPRFESGRSQQEPEPQEADVPLPSERTIIPAEDSVVPGTFIFSKTKHSGTEDPQAVQTMLLAVGNITRKLAKALQERKNGPLWEFHRRVVSILFGGVADMEQFDPDEYSPRKIPDASQMNRATKKELAELDKDIEHMIMNMRDMMAGEDNDPLLSWVLMKVFRDRQFERRELLRRIEEGVFADNDEPSAGFSSEEDEPSPVRAEHQEDAGEDYVSTSSEEYETGPNIKESPAQAESIPATTAQLTWYEENKERLILVLDADFLMLDVSSESGEIVKLCHETAHDLEGLMSNCWKQIGVMKRLDLHDDIAKVYRELIAWFRHSSGHIVDRQEKWAGDANVKEALDDLRKTMADSLADVYKRRRSEVETTVLVQRLGTLRKTPCLYKAWTRACAAECGGTCTP